MRCPRSTGAACSSSARHRQQIRIRKEVASRETASHDTEVALRGGRQTAGALAALVACGLLTPAAATAVPDPPPNIVVVTTDDQDLGSLSSRTMPNVTRLLKGKGVTFTDSVVSGPLCCPSRAVFLTGQYGHNNGVLWNNPNPYGDLREKGNTLPVWLRRSGYRTAHVGRYLNLYERAVASPNEVPPGWDLWHTILEPLQYFDYTMRVNGSAVRYGARDRDYLTRVINRTATNLIRRHAGRRKPLFMVVDHLAPHTSAELRKPCQGSAAPDPRDEGAFATEPLPRPPSFNEPDVSDKPSFIRQRPGLGQAANAELTRRHRCRLESLRAVDRGVGQIHRALRREDELNDTVLLFTSDNGWFDGEHRIAHEKVIPYEEALRVPLIIRAPPALLGGKDPSRAVAAPVANVDLAPTILDIGRAPPCNSAGRCRTLDGRSLLPLLRGNRGAWPSDRGILLELEIPHRRAAPLTPCDYEGIRTARHVYIEHHSASGANGGACRPAAESELYDLWDDPFQLSNLSPTPPGTAAERREARLADRLAALRSCTGVAGRDPLSPGASHCE